MKYSLEFNDPSSEERFLLSKIPFQARSLRFIIAILFLQIAELLYLALSNLERPQMLKATSFFLTMGLIAICSLMISLKLPRFSAKTIALVAPLSVIASSELMSLFPLDIQSPYRIYLNFGVYTEVLGIVLALSRISWTHAAVFFSITSTYSWLRVRPDSIQSWAFAFLICQILTVMGFCFYAERNDRKNFLHAEKSAVQLISYEEIMNSALQSSIIFLRNGEATFCNNFARQNLGLASEKQSLDILKSIKIIKRGGINEFVQHIGEGNKLNPRGQTISLYELYKDCEDYALDIQDSFQPVFSSLVGEMRNSSRKDVQTLVIQMGPAYWNNHEGILIIMNDISHIKRYYQNIETRKDSLLATVTHDLRAPLNGILGMLNILFEEQADEAAREKLKISIISAKLMHFMINDILDFSLFSKGKLRLKFETTNLSSLVEETVKIMSLQAEAKGILLQFENSIVDREGNHLVDGNRLRQVLLNLIGNAIKYTKAGKVVVRVKEERVGLEEGAGCEEPGLEGRLDLEKGDHCSEDDSEELAPNRKAISSNSIDHSLGVETSVRMSPCRRLLFEVEDSGIGIKPEHIRRLFKLFSRVTSGHDESMSGIGLGLAISQSLVILMNRKIRGAIIKAESRFGEGSVFRFPIYVEDEPSEIFKEVVGERYSLPIFKTNTREIKNDTSQDLFAPLDAFKASEEEQSLYPEEKKKTQVLIVDDDQLNLLVASKYLKPSEEFLCFQLARNGEQAISVVCEHAARNSFFDVIFMDCNMPFMDGYETTKKLKVMMKENKIRWAPVVALTGSSSEADKDRCKSAGMDGVLNKPYMKAELMKIINDATKG